jgi:hypothetical protein
LKGLDELLKPAALDFEELSTLAWVVELLKTPQPAEKQRATTPMRIATLRGIIISSRAGVGRDAALAKHDAVWTIAEAGDGSTDLSGGMCEPPGVMPGRPTVNAIAEGQWVPIDCSGNRGASAYPVSRSKRDPTDR